MQCVCFFSIPVWLLDIFFFRYSSVLNLPESSTLLLSETRLHGKQDKPEGSRHVKNEKEAENRQTEKSLTNPGYTGFLWKFRLVSLNSRKCLLGKRTLELIRQKTQRGRQSQSKRTKHAVERTREWIRNLYHSKTLSIQRVYFFCMPVCLFEIFFSSLVMRVT